SIGNRQAAGWRVFLTAHLMAEALHVCKMSWQPALWNLTKEEIPAGNKVGKRQLAKGKRQMAACPAESNEGGNSGRVGKKQKESAFGQPGNSPPVYEIRIRDGTVTRIRAGDANIAVGFPEWMAMPNQRNKYAHKEAGLQPHSTMWLEPEELLCSSVNRQLKQTAMEEKHHWCRAAGHDRY
ncbi:MAG: hypothetical protein R6U16_04775, partial [Desulfotignum sp.]